MSELARWSLKVSRDTDIALRTLLATRGGRKGDLSRFVEEAVNREALRETIRDARARNADADPQMVEQLIADELAAIRVHFRPADRRRSVCVILDTNILLSGIISPLGLSANLIEAWLDHRFTLVSHALQLDEIREVSRRDEIRALVAPAALGRIVNHIALVARCRRSCRRSSARATRATIFLLALAEASAADWLVTDDKDDLLVLKQHGVTRIIDSRAFADQLKLT